MKNAWKRTACLVLCAVLLLAAWGCGKDSAPDYLEPNTEKQNLNLFLSTYTTSKNLSPERLYLANDRSAVLTYRFTGSGQTESEAADRLDELIETLNRAIYSESGYEKGYRMFWRTEEDVRTEDSKVLVSMRIRDLTKVHKEYYRSETVGEFVERVGSSSDMMYEFRPVDNSGEKYRINDLPEEKADSLRIWHLRSVTESLEISLEGYPLYFYDNGKKTITKEDDAFVFSQKDNLYLVYQEGSPLNVTYLALGVACGVLAVAAVVGVVLSVVRRKQRNR